MLTQVYRAAAILQQADKSYMLRTAGQKERSPIRMAVLTVRRVDFQIFLLHEE